MDFRGKGDPAMKAPPEHHNIGQAGGSTGKQQSRSLKLIFAFPQQSTELPIHNTTDVLKIQNKTQLMKLHPTPREYLSLQ